MGFTINTEVTLPNEIKWTGLIVSIGANITAMKNMDSNAEKPYILRAQVNYYVNRAKPNIHNELMMFEMTAEEINDHTTNFYQKFYAKIKEAKGYSDATTTDD